MSKSTVTPLNATATATAAAVAGNDLYLRDISYKELCDLDSKTTRLQLCQDLYQVLGTIKTWDFGSQAQKDVENAIRSLIMHKDE
ncbi:hypothetical protein P0D75_18405 [Paraburkholderia sediminicola]|uniref:hypothetical protein n=1 Tax=Paraburkholderia sediminicola TaxID=458836 RepID=UPI0038BCB17E